MFLLSIFFLMCQTHYRLTSARFLLKTALQWSTLKIGSHMAVAMETLWFKDTALITTELEIYFDLVGLVAWWVSSPGEMIAPHGLSLPQGLEIGENPSCNHTDQVQIFLFDSIFQYSHILMKRHKIRLVRKAFTV